MNKSILSLALLGGLVAVTAAQAEAPRSGIGNDRTGNTVSTGVTERFAAPNDDIQGDVQVTAGLNNGTGYTTQTASNEAGFATIEPAAGPSRIRSSNNYDSKHSTDIEFGQ